MKRYPWLGSGRFFANLVTDIGHIISTFLYVSLKGDGNLLEMAEIAERSRTGRQN
jgi:hypothetical protein